MSTTLEPTVRPDLNSDDLDLDDGSRDVAVAASWLDLEHPGWARRIDLDKFNMGWSDRCIGGQIGVHWWNLTDSCRQATGLDNENLFATYSDAWRAQILKRCA